MRLSDIERFTFQGLAKLASFVDVEKEGVGGAKDFFEAKAAQQSNSNKFEQEIKKEQEEKKKENKRHKEKQTSSQRLICFNNSNCKITINFLQSEHIVDFVQFS